MPNISPFEVIGKKTFLLLEQRTARYSPLPAVITLLAKDSATDKGIMYKFDPITGESKNGIEKLSYKIKQATILPYEDANHLKTLLVFSEDNQVYVYPESMRSILNENSKNTFLYNVDSHKGVLQGYSLAFSSERNVQATPTWNFKVNPSHIVALSVRPSIEKVHSQGRVLADRSVLYKYVNPNLIALATLTDDTLHKHVLSVYLIDGVTGLVVYSVSHKRASGPVHLVHSENWVVYSYFNERFRRIEMSAVELYEGATQSNSTAFSSHAVSQLPHAESQSYILPAHPMTMAATLTERGNI